MANEQNLDPATPGKVAIERGRNGGIKSGEAKRRKRSMKEDLEMLLSLTIKMGEQYDVDEIKSYAELNGKNLTVSQAMILKQIGIALKGGKESTRAFEVLRDTSGQKPADSINMNASVSNPLADMTTAELRAMANLEDPKPKRKRGRPKKVKTDD